MAEIESRPSLPDTPSEIGEQVTNIEAEAQVEQEAVLTELIQGEKDQRGSTERLLATLSQKASRLAQRAALVLSLVTAHETSTAWAQDLVNPPHSPVQESVKQPETVETIEDRVRHYRQELALYKGLGRTLSVEREISAEQMRELGPQDADSVDLGMTLFDRIGPQSEHNIGFSISKDPSDHLQKLYAIQKELPPEFVPTNTKISIYPLSIDVTDADEQRHERTIKLVNWFDAEHPVIFETVVPQSGVQPQQMQALEDAIVRACDQTAEWVKAIQEISADTAQARALIPTVGIDHTKKVSDSSERVLAAAVDSSESFEFEVVGNGQEVDRNLWNGSFELTPERLKVIDGSPIDVHGQLSQITIMRDYTYYTFDQEQGTIDGRPVVQTTTDKYRNIQIKFFVTYHGSHEAKEITHVLPPITFSRNASDQGKQTPIDIDFSNLGGGQVEGAFFQEVEVPLELQGPNGEYGIYSNMPHAEIQRTAGQYFPELAAGITRAEVLFGKKPGEIVKNIYIVNSKRPNAYAQRKDPETIAIQDELLDHEGQTSAMTAFHETMHVLDLANDISGGELKALHLRLKTQAEFFSALDEKSFLPNSAGGHSADNEKEFFASFMNSMTHPDWELAMAKKTPEFRQAYLETLKTLQRILRSKEAISQQAPVFTELARRIEMLEK